METFEQQLERHIIRNIHALREQQFTDEERDQLTKAVNAQINLHGRLKSITEKYHGIPKFLQTQYVKEHVHGV